MKIVTALTAFLLYVCSASEAQLSWESQLLKFYPLPSENEVIAHFKFTNSGNHPVSISELKSSCGCTRASSAKKTYASTERGEVTAVFHIKSHYGIQEQSVTVKTDDPNDHGSVLVLQAAMMDVLQIKPSFLYWERGESPAAKRISIKVQNDLPVKIITADSDNPKIAARVECITSGREFRIVVTPSGTGEQTKALLTIRTGFPAASPKTYIAHVLIK